MKNSIIKSILVIFLASFFYQTDILAQSKAEVKNVDFNLVADRLVINYDILNYKSNEYFEISVKVETVSGKVVIPVSMVGDCGPNISGGVQKKIVWNFKQDNFATNEEFFVDVIAISNLAKKVENVQKKQSVSSEITTSGALLRSAIVPGWGLQEVTGKSAYFFLGVAGYGMIATSILMNRSASENYDNYLLELSDPEKRADYFDKAEKQDKLSKNIAIAAGVIWVGNLVWTGLKASGKQKNHTYNSKGFHFGSSYMCDNSIPILGLRYNF